MADNKKLIDSKPTGIGVPKTVTPVADVQGVSPSGVSYQDNTPVGLAGNPTNDKSRAEAIARRLQSTMSASKQQDRARGKS